MLPLVSLTFLFSALTIASDLRLCNHLPNGCPEDAASQSQQLWGSLEEDVAAHTVLDSAESPQLQESYNTGSQFGVGEASMNLDDESPSSWSFDPRCMRRYDSTQTYCIFTNSTFAANRGISIFTTPDHAEKFVRLEAFTDINHSPKNNLRPNPPYVMEPVPGRGYGLVANRTVFRGDRIMSHSPVLLIHDAILDQFAEQDYFRFQNAAVHMLPKNTRNSFMNLDVQSKGDSVADIIATNSFSVNIFDESDPTRSSYTVVVPEISRLNHDCRPNAYYHFDLKTLTHHVQASRTIQAGEEITISYIPQLQTQDQRQSSLKEHWGFPCDCSLCSAPPSIAAASDARILRINELREQLSDYSSHAKVTPSMAELLVSLYEQERLWGPINEAYGHAAIEFNAVGKTVAAERYASLAFEAGLIYRGGQHKDVMDMKTLLYSPRAHWSWKFRSSKENRNRLY